MTTGNTTNKLSQSVRRAKNMQSNEQAEQKPVKKRPANSPAKTEATEAVIRMESSNRRVWPD